MKYFAVVANLETGWTHTTEPDTKRTVARIAAQSLSDNQPGTITRTEANLWFTDLLSVGTVTAGKYRATIHEEA